MQHRTKRLLGVILALCLALSTLSMMVTAAEPKGTIPGGICGTTFTPFQMPTEFDTTFYTYAWKDETSKPDWLNLDSASGVITATSGKYPNTPQAATTVTVEAIRSRTSGTEEIPLTVGEVIASGTLTNPTFIPNVNAELTNATMTPDGWVLTLTPATGFSWKTMPSIRVGDHPTASAVQNYAENTSNKVTFTFSAVTANFDVVLEGGAVAGPSGTVTNPTGIANVTPNLAETNGVWTLTLTPDSGYIWKTTPTISVTGSATAGDATNYTVDTSNVVSFTFSDVTADFQVELTAGAVLSPNGTVTGSIANVTPNLAKTDGVWTLTLTPVDGYIWKTTPTISVTGSATAGDATNYTVDTSNVVSFTFSNVTADFQVELTAGAVLLPNGTVTGSIANVTPNLAKTDGVWTLTLTPDAGYIWKTAPTINVAEGATAGDATNYTVDTSNVVSFTFSNVTADFQVALTAGAVAALGGTITNKDSFPNITQVISKTADGWTLTLTPKDGYKWKTEPTISKIEKAKAENSTGYEVNTSNSVTFTITDVTGDFQITLGGGTVEQQQYTVTFDSNGGTAVLSQTVKHGETPIAPATPKNAGLPFLGWFTAKTEGTKVADWTAQAITAPVTYYAQWGEPSSGVTIHVTNNTGKDFVEAPLVKLGGTDVTVENSAITNVYTGVGTISKGSHQLIITYKADGVTKNIAQIVDITSATQVLNIALETMGKNGVTLNTTQPILINAPQNVQSNGADLLNISITSNATSTELKALAEKTFYDFDKGILLDITINDGAVTSTTQSITYQYSLGDDYKDEDIALFTKHGENAAKRIASTIKTTPDGKKAVVFSSAEYSSFYVAYGTLVNPALIASTAPTASTASISSIVAGTSRRGSGSGGYSVAGISIPLRDTTFGQPAISPVTGEKIPAETGR